MLHTDVIDPFIHQFIIQFRDNNCISELAYIAFNPTPFNESGKMIGAVPTHGHTQLGPHQRHGELGTRLYVLNFV
jgi:hypothetical protein